jgi:hypothetical protein
MVFIYVVFSSIDTAYLRVTWRVISKQILLRQKRSVLGYPKTGGRRNTYGGVVRTPTWTVVRTPTRTVVRKSTPNYV